MEVFVLERDALETLLQNGENERDVLLPFLGYEDLVANEAQQTHRWCIYFSDWPLARAEAYPTCLGYIRDRLAVPSRSRWWQFRRPTPELYRAIAENERVLVVGETSEAVSPVFVANGQVFTKTLIIFSDETGGFFAVIASSLHRVWVLHYGSTLETRAKYIITDCFETFPFPPNITSLEAVGERYHTHRRGVMAARREGLTATYNRFHSPHEVSTDIATLRKLHVEMDYAVAAAYGWTDLDLGHGFHETKQGTRYTISEPARREVLDRLLELNHQRHAAETAAVSPAKPKRVGRKRGSGTAAPSLFDSLRG